VKIPTQTGEYRNCIVRIRSGVLHIVVDEQQATVNGSFQINLRLEYVGTDQARCREPRWGFRPAMISKWVLRAASCAEARRIAKLPGLW
jgi:hypothetical protein